VNALVHGCRTTPALAQPTPRDLLASPPMGPPALCGPLTALRCLAVPRLGLELIDVRGMPHLEVLDGRGNQLLVGYPTAAVCVCVCLCVSVCVCGLCVSVICDLWSVVCGL
jgi:hypothetical protein